MTVDFEAQVSIPEGSKSWTELLPEVPHNATMLEARLWLRPQRQFLVLVYRGVKNGEPHQRKSQQRVSLTTAQAATLLLEAYPGIPRAAALASVITASEVPMSEYSPEAVINGFVSKTGKRHLVGSTDPDSTYVQTACSNKFSHGVEATFPVKDLDCAKCRKIAGLDE